MPRITAFLLAKQLQPGLGNPAAFRPEKISLLAQALSAMLDHEGRCLWRFSRRSKATSVPRPCMWPNRRGTLPGWTA